MKPSQIPRSDEQPRYSRERNHLATTVLMGAFLLTTGAPKSTAAQTFDLGALADVIPSLIGSPAALDLSDCEKPSQIEYFVHSGCPGYLTALRDMDVNTLRRSRAQVVLYLEGLITPLYNDKTFFVQGAPFMHALPPRLPVSLKMLKLRTPEIFGLQLHDTLRMANQVVTPLLNAPPGETVNQIRGSMRQLGIEPLPSTVMPMLGTHDSYLLQMWAQDDPEGLADFMIRVQSVIDQL